MRLPGEGCWSDGRAQGTLWAEGSQCGRCLARNRWSNSGAEPSVGWAWRCLQQVLSHTGSQGTALPPARPDTHCDNSQVPISSSWSSFALHAQQPTAFSTGHPSDHANPGLTGPELPALTRADRTSVGPVPGELEKAQPHRKTRT